MNAVRLIAVGDISLQTRNNSHPFQNVKRVFESKDILFGNLETVLSAQGKKAEKAVLLYSPPEKVKYLKDVGFDVLNIANNHILDLGIEGFKNTLDTLSENNLTFIGANAGEYVPTYTILEREGIKFGFLGYTGNYLLYRNIPLNRLKGKRIIADIEVARSKCDLIIVSLHWGTENVFYPSPKQIDLAHNLIDHGATLVLGHHPHIIQGIEKYQNGLIAYSLGNFQFNPEVSQSKTNNSIILSLDFNKDKLVDYNVIPIVIDEDFLPCIVEGQDEDRLLHFISEISQPIRNGGVTNKWWFEQIANEYLSGNLRSYTLRIRRHGIKPLLECALWLITPFCIRCYAGIVRTIWRKHFGQVKK